MGVSTYDLLSGYSDTRNNEEPIKLQTVRVENPKAGYAYWGGVLDEAKKVAKDKDMQEISLILPMLKMAYDTLISVLDKEQEFAEAGLSNVSAYNGDNSSYTGNTLTVGATA